MKSNILYPTGIFFLKKKKLLFVKSRASTCAVVFEDSAYFFGGLADNRGGIFIALHN